MGRLWGQSGVHVPAGGVGIGGIVMGIFRAKTPGYIQLLRTNNL